MGKIQPQNSTTPAVSKTSFSWCKAGVMVLGVVMPCAITVGGYGLWWKLNHIEQRLLLTAQKIDNMLRESPADTNVAADELAELSSDIKKFMQQFEKNLQEWNRKEITASASIKPEKPGALRAQCDLYLNGFGALSEFRSALYTGEPFTKSLWAFDQLAEYDHHFAEHYNPIHALIAEYAPQGLMSLNALKDELTQGFAEYQQNQAHQDDPTAPRWRRFIAQFISVKRDVQMHGSPQEIMTQLQHELTEGHTTKAWRHFTQLPEPLQQHFAKIRPIFEAHSRFFLFYEAASYYFTTAYRMQPQEK